MVYFRCVGAHIILFDNIFVKRDQNESKTEKKIETSKKKGIITAKTLIMCFKKQFCKFDYGC